MTDFETAIKYFRKGEQTLARLLTTTQRLVERDGIGAALISNELSKLKHVLTLAPNVIDAIEQRLQLAPQAQDGQAIQPSQELIETLEWDDIQNDNEVSDATPPYDCKKPSNLYGAPSLKPPSSTRKPKPSTAEELVGLTLNERYELVSYVGSGGMGSVYKAIDRKQLKAGFHNPCVAIKILHCELGAQNNLQHETERWQNLSHPNIVEVYGANQDDAIAYLVMEYLAGISLKDKMGAPGFTGLPMEYSQPIIWAMGEALAFAHEQDIIHTDFKPSNVIMTEDGQIKVIDFGIARVLREEDTWAPPVTKAVTPAYTNTETLEHDSPDLRDDIFAFACTTYELLTGKHPFDHKKACEAKLLSLRPQAPQELPPAQWKALEMALELNPDKRPNDLRQLIEDILPHRRMTLSNPIVIRGVATLVVLCITVVGTYLGNASVDRHGYGYGDLSVHSKNSYLNSTDQAPAVSIPLPRDIDTDAQPSATTAQPFVSESHPQASRTQGQGGPDVRSDPQDPQTPPSQNDEAVNWDSKTETANDSADFATVREQALQTDTDITKDADLPLTPPAASSSAGSDKLTDTNSSTDKAEHFPRESPSSRQAQVSTEQFSVPLKNGETTESEINDHGPMVARRLSTESPLTLGVNTDNKKPLAPADLDKLNKLKKKLATLKQEILPNQNTGTKPAEQQSIRDVPSPVTASPSSLFHNISNGDTQAVKAALDSGVSANARMRSTGMSTLMLAASTGRREIIDLLLDAKADIDLSDRQGRTALYWAAVEGHARAVKQLLDYGAKANLRDKNGETALVQATWAGHDAVVQELVKEHADINMSNQRGLTPLMVASINGHTTIVESLLNAGADPNIAMRDGKTALMAAAWNGHVDIVKLLTESDCLLNTRSGDGRTALINAAWNGYETIVRDLVRAGANPDIVDHNRMSAAQAALSQGFNNVADFLKKIRDK